MSLSPGQNVQVAGQSFRLQASLIDRPDRQRWRALRESDGRQAFLKIAFPDQDAGAMLLENEASVLERLASPAYPTLLCYGISACGHRVLATEWLEGASLQQELRGGKLSAERLKSLGSLLWNALEGLHEAGIVHGDLKPEHLLLTNDGLRLCDFGLAVHGHSSTSTGVTVAYASPEQLGLLNRPVSYASDLYSAGVILAEGAQGCSPWQDSKDLTRRLIPFEAPLERSDLPFSFHPLLSHLLESDPHARYATAKAVREDWQTLWSQPHRLVALGTTDQRSHLTTPTLVGRRQDLEQMNEYLRQDQRWPLWISACSGRGKSRLLQALSQRARAPERIVISARCSQHRTHSNELWSEVFKKLRQQLSPAQLELALETFSQGKVISRAFLSSGSDEPHTALREDLNAEALADALLTFFQHLPYPILLCLDDLQWAQPFTMLLLRHELPERVKIIAAYRQDEMPQPTNGPLLELQPLDEAKSAQMLLSMAGPLPPEAVRDLVARAQGEPFLLSALLLGAREMGILKEGEQGWIWSSDGTLQTGLRAGLILSQRLSLCDKDTLSFLSAGAILGREFSVAHAGAVAKVAQGVLEEVLESAKQRHLIWPQQDSRALFSHDKIRESLLEGLPTDERQAFHQRAAEWLERQDEPSESALAYHWSSARQPHRAFPYASRAGQTALRRLDLAGAAELLELARRCWPETLERSARYRLLRDLAEAYQRLTHYDQAIETHKQALDCAEDHERALAVGELSLTCVLSMQKEEAAILRQRGLTILQPSKPGNPLLGIFETLKSATSFLWSLRRNKVPKPGRDSEELRAEVRLQLAVIHNATYDGDTLTLFRTLAKACETLSKRSGPAEGAQVWALAGIFSVAIGRVALAGELFEQAKRAADTSPRFRGSVLAKSAFLSLAKENLKGAKLRFHQGALLSQTQGELWDVDTARGYSALTSYLLGEIQEARDIAKHVKNRQTLQETNFYGTNLVLAMCGDLVETSSRSVENPESLSFRRLQFLKLYADGLIALQRKTYNQACLLLEHATNLVNLEMVIWGASALPWLATAWRVTAEELPNEATAERKRLLRKAERASSRALSGTRQWKITRSHALREAALASAHSGRFALARSRFQQSYDLSEKQGRALESAWTLYERGRFAEAAGWRDWAGDMVEGLARVRRLGGWLPGVDLSSPEPQHHLAKLDRFDRVLESGRRLVLLEGETQVLEALQEEARSLLRCDRVLLVYADQLPEELSRTLYERCLSEGRAVTEAEVDEPSRSLLLHEARSTLMAPLKVSEELVAVLVAWQKTIGGFFGEEETRLADYLCALAGAGLENARILAQRQQTFAALQSSEQRFRGFFEYAGVGTALLDESGFILQENPYLQTLLGGSTLGKTPWQLAHAADRENLKAAFACVRDESRHRYDTETRLHRAGGEVAWTQSCLVSLPLRDGDRSRYLLTVADTTHRRIAEMMEFLENERRSLAAEVHDELAKNLSALHMLLAGLKSNDHRILKATAMAHQLVDDTKGLMASLRNPLAEGVDLMAALKSLVTNFSVDCEADIDVSWPDTFAPLSDLAGLVLYRVLQEGLTNIGKHANATSVRLRFSQSLTHLQMTLSDNGQGFDAGLWLKRRNAQKHFGVLSMRDRAEMVGGHLTIDSVSQGTQLNLALPTSGDGHL